MLLGCCDAGVLHKAVGLLGIGYCARLLDVDLYAKTRTGLLGIGCCARLLSCCDAGVLHKAVGR